MLEQVETEQFVNIFGELDKIVQNAYNRSELLPFYDRGFVWLTNLVQFTLSNQMAPVWNCGPSVNLYGQLYIDASNILSLASPLGLFVDLMDMNSDLIEAVERFISESFHYNFYDYENSSDNAENFYSEALFNSRPVRLSLLWSPSIGTYKDSFLYLLASGDGSCCYSSYDEYYSNFFLCEMSSIVEDVVSDDSQSRDIMGYLERNRSKIIRWFEKIDKEFLNAFGELDRRLDILVRSLYRIE